MERSSNLLLRNNTNLIIAKGHVHRVQFIKNRKTKHIISRARGKVDLAKKCEDGFYASSAIIIVKAGF